MEQKQEVEVIYISTRKVACDGGVGSLGHPKVYLNMGDKNQITCPYCSKCYILTK